MPKNTLCHNFGCRLGGRDEFGYSPDQCVRCGSGLYDPDFVQTGRLEPVIWWMKYVLGWLPYRIAHRCNTCRKPMLFSAQPAHSGKCTEDWVPF